MTHTDAPDPHPEPGAVRLLPPGEVAGRASLSVRTLQRRVKDGEAPTPVKVSANRIGFLAHEVDAWLAALPRTREAV